jgi:hypothetical protein
VILVWPRIVLPDSILADSRGDHVLFVNQMQMEVIARSQQVAQRKEIEILFWIQEVLVSHQALLDCMCILQTSSHRRRTTRVQPPWFRVSHPRSKTWRKTLSLSIFADESAVDWPDRDLIAPTESARGRDESCG